MFAKVEQGIDIFNSLRDGGSKLRGNATLRGHETASPPGVREDALTGVTLVERSAPD